jgi:thiol-disulfide isomerase/thioredoxin
MRRISTGIVGVVVACVGLLGPEAWESQVIAGTADSAAPAFELVTFAGEAYSKESLKGQPTLLVFWAPWCKVCQRELPLLGQFYQQERPTQLRVVSIGFADTRTNVEAFVKARAGVFVFPTAYDEERWVAQAFKVNATPTYVLVDAQGNIALAHRGGGLLQNVRFREFLSTLKG